MGPAPSAELVGLAGCFVAAQRHIPDTRRPAALLP
jgi:hypothetical protein